MRRLGFTSTAILAASTLLASQAGLVVPLDAVVQAIERELEAAGVPGASFAIASENHIRYGRVGVADAARGEPITADTLMQIGSLNKFVTALALSATLEEREIAFDDALGEHVPGLSPRLASVTFHQLLSHISGLRDVPGGTGTTDEAALATRVRAISDADFMLPAGTVFSYSNLGYAAAGLALEHLRKKPFADALRETVFEPLPKARATMRPPVAPGQPHAVGHRGEKGTIVPIREIDIDTSLWPAGYLWASAADMGWLLAVLTSPSSVGFGLPRSSFTRAASPHTPMPNVFVGGHYGYGLMLGEDRGTRIYEHGGTQRGFSSILRVAPEQRFGLVILTNLDNAPLRRIAQKVMAEALGLPAQTPATRAEIAVTADEMKEFVGVYRNRGTAEIAVRDGRVVLILDGGAPMLVSRIGQHRYLAKPKPEIAGPEFVLQPATTTAPAYLHFALWAYTKGG
jgi:CubicO group peptidase (beta-lactamase class C family)